MPYQGAIQAMPAFIDEILSQPETLRRAIEAWNLAQFAQAATTIRAYHRVVLTGMGASFAALLPAWRILVDSGVPAWHVDTAELLSLGNGLLGPGTLVVAASQSGRSVELVMLAERIRNRGALLAITNESSSPLADAATLVFELHSGPEDAVSTKSYLNTLAVGAAIAALAATMHDNARVWSETLDDWLTAANAIDIYLRTWRRRVDSFKACVGLPQRSILIGRGSSMAAAIYGALIGKEAAKWAVEPMSSSQFRHGPLEIVDSRLTAFVFAGHDDVGRGKNLTLATEIAKYGGKVCWLDSDSSPEYAFHIELPSVRGRVASVGEALPLQLLSIAVAELSDIEPGRFRYLQKVTTVE